MTEIYHFNYIEKQIRSDMLLPVKFVNQINFTNVAQVRQYVRDRGSKEKEEDDPFKLITVMMEVFFGHHSTCALNHVELVGMWKKLFINSIKRLYQQNRLLVPESKRATETYYEPYILEALHHAEQLAIAETESKTPLRKQLTQEYTSMVRDKYRSKIDLITFFSEYMAVMGRRFYHTPFHLGPTRVKQYVSLKTNLINVWCDTVNPKNVLHVNLDAYLSDTDPRNVAFKLFSPDKLYSLSDIDTVKKKFDVWLKREQDSSIIFAEKSGDGDYIKKVRERWNEATVFGDQFYNALLPRAEAISEGECVEETPPTTIVPKKVDIKDHPAYDMIKTLGSDVKLSDHYDDYVDSHVNGIKPPLMGDY